MSYERDIHASVADETRNLSDTVESTHSTGRQLTPAGIWAIWSDVDALLAVSQSSSVEAQSGSYALPAYYVKRIYSNGSAYVSVERIGSVDGTCYFNLEETE